MTVADILAELSVQIGFGLDAVGSNYMVLNDPVKGLLDDGAGTYNTLYELAPGSVFSDVTDHVKAINIERGRDREIDEYGTGVATVVFNDNDRTFDPAYSGSPYFGKITPKRRIVIRWDRHELFNGWVDDWTVVYEPGNSMSRVTADCIDGLGILANQELDEVASSFAGDTSGVRIRRVLDLDEVTFPSSRNIEDGLSTLGATTLGGNALAYLQACARAEAGYLFVDISGTLRFRSRSAVLNMMADVIVSDDRDAGIPYRTITQGSTADLLYTRVTGESETTGVQKTSHHVDASHEFFVRTLALGTLFLSNDAQTLNLCQFYASRFSRVEERFRFATFNMGALTEGQVHQFTALDLTDVISVQRLPLDTGGMINRLSVVDGIRHSISSGSWTAELSFANADSRSFFTLNDEVLGELGAYQLAF